MRRMVAGIVGIMLILASLNYQPVRAASPVYVRVNGHDTLCNGTVDVDYSAGVAPNCAFKTIQRGMNQVDNGGTVNVAAEDYKWSTNGESFPISIFSKNLTLIGKGASTTTVDAADPSKNVFYFNNNANVSISGFTIKGGLNGLYYNNGSSGTITNNTISGNSADGVLNMASSNPLITNNTITENGSKGIMNSSSSPTIANNTITGNNTGIENENSSSPTITSNTIRGNIGGIYSSYSSNPTITNNIIAGNSSDGIWNSDSSNPTITNNTIVGNKDGIYCRNSSNPTITNNIFASNTRYGINASSGSTPTNTYNDVWGNGTADYIGTSGGTGSISANPLFSSMSPYHLLCGSPAIDAGKDYPPNGIPPGMPPDDKDGVTRPIGAHYDMGAYEGCVMEPRPKPQLPSLLPVAQNNISQGNGFLKQANDLLSQAKAKGADTAQCEKVVTEAKELLDKAKASLTNPIYANNLALQALEKLKQAVDCLKALLG